MLISIFNDLGIAYTALFQKHNIIDARYFQRCLPCRFQNGDNRSCISLPSTIYTYISIVTHHHPFTFASISHLHYLYPFESRANWKETIYMGHVFRSRIASSNKITIESFGIAEVDLNAILNCLRFRFAKKLLFKKLKR